MKSSLRLLATFLTLGTIFLLACEHDVPEPIPVTTANQNNPDDQLTYCDPDTVYYNRDIDRMLTSTCAFSGCHDQASRQDGVDVTSYQALINSDIIKPFQADESDLIEVLFETDPDKVMPPPGNTKLTTEQIDLLRKWINQGARNTICIDSCDTTNVTFSKTVFPIIQQSCIGCHSNASLGGGIFLTDYEDIKAETANNRLLGAIEHLDGYNAMPFGQKKLPSCQINQIDIWIRNGAKNN